MEENIKLKLLANLPITISNNIKVIPLTLKKIVEIGYDKYNTYLTHLASDPEDYSLKIDDLEKVQTWDILLSNMIYGTDEYRNILTQALELFLGDGVVFCIVPDSPDDSYFCIGEDNLILNRDNYEEFKNILKIMNCVKREENKVKFANKRAEEMANRIMKEKMKLKKEDDITFCDLISVLAANGNHINILNIWDLSMYQFNNQFARMQMIENYNVNIRSLLAGAKKEDVDLKHYIRPINEKE